MKKHTAQENNHSAYIQPDAIKKARSSGMRRTVIGGICLAFLGLGYLGMFLDVGSAAFSDASNIAGSMMFMMIIALILAPFAALLVSGVRRLRNARRAVTYAELFEQDEDGYLLYSEVAEHLKIPESRVPEDIKELIRRKYICCVSYADGDPGCILLTGREDRRWHEAYYVSEEGVMAARSQANALTVLGAMFGISIVITLPAMFVMTMESNDSGDALYAMMNLAMLAGFGWMLLLARRNRACLKRSGIYNQYMEESAQADVPLAQMAEKAGVSTGTTEKDIKWLFNKRVLHDCRPNLSGTPSILLADVNNGTAAFAALNCPGCGSTARIRVGRTGKCGYCGRFLTAPMTGGGVGGAVHAGSTRRAGAAPGLFLDEGGMQKIQSKMMLRYFIGGFLMAETVVTLFFIVSGFSSDPAGLAGIFMTAATFAIPGVWLILRGRRFARALRLATVCDPLFGQSSEASLSHAKIAASIGWQETAVKKTLTDIFRWDMMDNCLADGDRVILTDRSHMRSAYIHTECKHCGAALTIKRGFVSVCRFCGAFVDENGVTHVKEGIESEVILTDIGPNRGAVISYLRDLTGMSLPEVEELIGSVPVTVVKTGRLGAQRIRAELARLGAVTEQ